MNILLIILNLQKKIPLRRSVSAALSELNPDTSSVSGTSSSLSSQLQQQKSQHNPNIIKPRSLISDSESDEDVSSDGEEQEDGLTPLQRFLTAWGLAEHYHMYSYLFV